jgi:hypothetical protein
MNDGGSFRRGLSAASIVAGLLLVGTAWLARDHGRGSGGGDRAEAAALRARLAELVRSTTRSLEPKVTAASRLQGIVSGLDLEADPHTFDDLLANEDWWAPIRAEFSIFGVVAPSGSLAVRGLDARKLADTPLVRQALEVGVASAVVSIDGRSLMLAAARVPPGKRRVSGAVVVLGDPFERAALQPIAEAASVPLALSDGKRLLTTAGPPGAEAAFAAVVGREDSSRDDRAEALALPLDRGLWLLAPMPGAPPRAALPGPTPILAGCGIALAGFGVVLQLVARRRRRAATTPVPAGAGAERLTPGRGPNIAPRPATGNEVPAGPVAVARAPVAGAPSWAPAGAPFRHAPALAAPTAAVAEAIPEPLPASPSRPVPASPSGPVTLGRYRLLERIGEGGMAEIFIAAAHGAEGFVRYFVLKRMHAHLARNRDAVNQFIDEARLQSALVHSNIVPVFDFGRAGDEYFLALEYIHGTDLERLVRRHVQSYGKSLSLPVAFYVMHEVLDALAYAHGRNDQEGRSMGIVHRDVAPGNILLSLRGEVKLSDFGIAKAEGRISRTELGVIKGNASFMSPEQARGELVDPRSDLFSVGVVLYYCLTAQFLYRDETMFNRLVRAAIGPAMSEFAQIDELPPMAATVLRRALSLDPAQRYQNAREFARDLAGHFTIGRAELADLMEGLFPEMRKEGR